MRRFTILISAIALMNTVAMAQQGDGTRVPISTNVFKPAKVAPTEASIRALSVPAGFIVNVFASGLRNARVLAVAPNGDVYLSRRDQGDVLLLRDSNKDGVADGVPTQVVNRPGVHGLAIKDNRLYMVTVKDLLVADIKADGTLGPIKMLAGDLPDAGQHANRTLAFGPDGMLYISIGSTCNACNESNPENATMLQVSPDGKTRAIFASGLRNTIGFDWQPQTGELWGMDHGIDFLGDDIQPEELNKIQKGKVYGWPHIWGKDGVNPQSTPVGDISKEEWKAMSTPMVLGYTAHAAPMQMVFYKGGSFPAEFNGDAFVTMRGSWNRDPSSGYEIVRIRFANGEPVKFESFVSGFLTDGGKTHIARPMGLAVASDGALLMADDANGVIYRISYRGTENGKSGANPPATAMTQQTNQGNHVPLALSRNETAAPAAASIQVSSPSFSDNADIPKKHSEYHDGVSPAISWTPVSGAKTYVVIMEDPDAKPTTPFIHWVAWNIPASITQLAEGLQEQPRLTEPDGVMQGINSRGSPGYYGPRPPIGDPAHRYFFQVLALDQSISLKPGADRDTVLMAVRGHVIGKGQLIGKYRQTAEPLK
jgi:Raf kinase inhibitor-like YbhB/YbcL family protein